MSQSRPNEILSSPFTLPCGQTLPNRIAKSAMSEVMGDPVTGAPCEEFVRLYERWGRGGAGLLITGNVMVALNGISEVGNLVVEDERHLPLLRRWAQRSQANGARTWVQINHCGRQVARFLDPAPIAPSAVPLRGFSGNPRALESREIEAMIRRFVTTSRVMKEAGFSGVQIHAAHGYLIGQFLSPLANVRADEWGGDGERRMRFLLAIIAAVRAEVGPHFAIGVKLNSADFQRGGFSQDDSVLVVRALEKAGVDLVEVSGGTYEAQAMIGRGEIASRARASTRAREAYFLEYAREMRSASKIPLLLTGGLRTAGGMAEAIAAGHVDLIGLARPLACEPDLPAALLSGTSEAAAVVRLRTGVRRIDDMLQVLWFQSQIHRMSRGLEPDLRLSKVGALARFVHALWKFHSGRRATRGRDRGVWT